MHSVAATAADAATFGRKTNKKAGLTFVTLYIGKQSGPLKTCGCSMDSDMDINCLVG